MRLRRQGGMKISSIAPRARGPVMNETTVPAEFLRDLDGVADPLVSRLMTMVVGLGGEVIVLRAALQRLR